MLTLIKKINGKAIKDFCTESKFCTFGNDGSSLEGKFGLIGLDFSSFGETKKCQLKFKRKSGNGLITVITDVETKNYNIISKVSENIIINLDAQKKVTISRPLSGIGNIDLISIYLMTDETIENNTIKSELNKCSKINIRTVDDKFYANSGSKLTSTNRIEIETSVPNSYTKNEGGNVIIFNTMCEITSIKLIPSEKDIDKNVSDIIRKSQLLERNLIQNKDNIKINVMRFSNSKKLSTDYDSSDVIINSIKFANYNSNNKGFNIDTVSGMRWLQKIKPIIDTDVNASISSIKNFESNLIIKKNVFIDAFNPESDKISDAVLEKLKTVQKIHTSSIKSKEFLQDKLGVDVVYTSRVWPYVEPKEAQHLLNKKYCIISNRNHEVTNFCIQVVLDTGKIPLVLGARGVYDPQVLVINEYTEYSKLISIIENAEMLIDFHQVQDQKSGLSDLCINLGQKLVTNSSAYTDEVFDNQISEYKIPNYDKLADLINEDIICTKNIERQKEDFDTFIRMLQ